MEFPAVAGPIVNILPKLLSVIDEKMKQLENLEVDVGFIERDLKSIQNLIGCSGGRLPDVWIQGLRRLGDDMEDCIDRFQVGKMNRIRFATEIGKLKKRSKDTLEQLQSHINIATATGQVVPPAADPDRPLGVKDPEEEKLIALLQSQSEEGKKLKLVCIAAFGGQGMTRLVHKVYKDRDVRNQFPLHAWVRAAANMGAQRILEEIHDQVLILSQFNGHAEHGASASHVDGLAGILKTGRYLIVIEDVKTDELYDVMSSFSWDDGVGGRIITTTTINLPEATCCTCGDGSSLAMDNTSQIFIRDVTESEYVQACNDLHHVTIAKMQLSNDKILSSLVVQDLLLYFGMFPRDHPVRRNPLIRQWMAEGLVFPPSETESLSSFCQDVAAKNLEMLINRNIVQPIQVRNYEKVKICQTSGMMLNSISNKSKSQNFITILCGQTRRIDQPAGDVRRLSLHLNSAANGQLNLPKDLSRLHSLAVFPETNVSKQEANLSYGKYKLLRVLDLKECADLKGEHVRKICDLLLLKYLSLGDSIDEVPRKIAKLKWLETLDMRRSQVVMVPIEVLQLPRLKHLLGKFQLFEGDLTEKKLEDLSKESELQKLSGFVTDSEGFSQLMSRIEQLRKVKIWCGSTADAENLNHLLEAMKKFIIKAMNLPRVDRSLSIDFQGCSPVFLEQQFTNTLKAPGRLTSLKLRGELTRLPQFQAGVNYIEELCLARTNLSWDTILSSLSGLFQTLKYLKLVEDKLGHFVIGPEHFRSLKGIYLVCEQRPEDITIQARAMPDLVSLHILCEALGDLPGIKITHMAKLKEIALHSGVQDEIKDRWQAAAMNHPNWPNVLFIRPANPRHRDSLLCGRNGTTANGTSPMGKLASTIKGIFSSKRVGSRVLKAPSSAKH